MAVVKLQSGLYCYDLTKVAMLRTVRQVSRALYTFISIQSFLQGINYKSAVQYDGRESFLEIQAE
jgi:hypothetical protein